MEFYLFEIPHAKILHVFHRYRLYYTKELIEIITQKSGFLLLVGIHGFTSSSGVREFFVVVV